MAARKALMSCACRARVVRVVAIAQGMMHIGKRFVVLVWYSVLWRCFALYF